MLFGSQKADLTPKAQIHLSESRGDPVPNLGSPGTGSKTSTEEGHHLWVYHKTHRPRITCLSLYSTQPKGNNRV